MQRLVVHWLFIGLVCVFPASLLAASYTHTVNFNPDQGYSYNHMWSHTLSSMPAGCDISSAEIQVRTKVWSWGAPSYGPLVLLASDTNTFQYPSDSVCSFTNVTHPDPRVFYTRTCSLSSEQLNWLNSNGAINLQLAPAFGGTYYLEFSTLEAQCAGPAAQVAMPTFTPGQGTLNSGQTIAIACNTPGARIYYTRNGAQPSEASTPYTEPIRIEEATTLRARAYRDGWTPSPAATGVFTIMNGGTGQATDTPWAFYIPVIVQAGQGQQAPCADLAGCYQGSFTDNCDGPLIGGRVNLTVNSDCTFRTDIDLGIQASGQLTERNGTTYSGPGRTDANGCGAFTVTCTDLGASVTCSYRYSNGRGGNIPNATARACN